MNAFLIVFFALLFIVLIVILFALLIKKDDDKLIVIKQQNKQLQNERKDLDKKIDKLHKKAQDVKDEKKPDNIDDLISEFSDIKR